MAQKDFFDSIDPWRTYAVSPYSGFEVVVGDTM
jgi:hypothetical protein